MAIFKGFWAIFHIPSHVRWTCDGFTILRVLYNDSSWSNTPIDMFLGCLEPFKGVFRPFFTKTEKSKIHFCSYLRAKYDFETTLKRFPVVENPNIHVLRPFGGVLRDVLAIFY